MMWRWKFRAMWLLVLLTGLAGCASVPTTPPPVQVQVTGPTFSKADFNCGPKPRPPAGDQASAGARYDVAMSKSWDRCQNKLNAVQEPLEKAGQVK